MLDATTFAGTSYTWSTGDISSSINVNTAGTYFVKATLGVCDAFDTTVVSITQYPTLNLTPTVSSCLGVCDAFDTTVVSITQYPTLNLTPTVSSRLGDSVKLDATNAAGTIYTWNNGATTPTLWIKSTGTYIVTASLNSCATNDTTIAVFNKTPVLNLPSLRDTCQGQTILLDATTFAGTSYTWSTGDISSSINVNTAGTYFVKATLGVCDAFDTTIVSITQYPTLNLTPTVSSCLGDSVKLDATNAAGTIYTWNNGATTPTLWIKSTGTYIVTASLNSCATNDTTVAVFNKTPVLNLPSLRDTCQGKTVLLDATTFAGTSYTWSTGQISSSINVGTSGIYSVKATLGVCDAFDTTVVTITQYPILNLPTNVASCMGDSVKLDATNAAGTIYTWNNGATTPIVWIRNSGTYSVVASLNSCITKDTSIIVFNSIPKTNLPPTVGFCYGDSATLNATSNITASSYLWNTGAIANSIVVKTTGTYLVDVKANGCITRDTTVVNVYPLPTVDAGLDLFVFKNQQVTIKAIASSDAINFTWKPSFNLSNANVLQPKILAPADTTYKIQVSSINGCSAVDFVKVTVLTDFVIPNVFSPNGDGLNDTWDMKGIENYPGLRVDIFDRYGRTVLSSLGYRKPWNGTLNNLGKPVPIGTYYYIIDTKNGNPPLTGSLTLLR